MRLNLSLLEDLVKRQTTIEESDIAEEARHVFDERNIHFHIQAVSKSLFDDGYFALSTLEAFKFVENEIQRLSGETASGVGLIGKVFSVGNPLLPLNDLKTQSEKDEQDGFNHLFLGATKAIRNPRAHSFVNDDPETCLDHLVFASMLLRRLESAGHI